MQPNSDFVAILQAFNAASVRYLVIGAYAVGSYARPRATGDIELLVASDPDNARRVFHALADFGAALEGIDATTFTERDIVFQIGIAPRRIDILTGIDGVSFSQAWTNRENVTWAETPVTLIGRDDLIANKRATGRPEDLADLERLRDDAPG